MAVFFMPGFSNADYFQDERHVYFQILNVDTQKWQPKRRLMNYFDIPPTLLDILGLLPKNHTRVALGSSIFKDDPEFNERQSKFKDDYYLFSKL